MSIHLLTIDSTFIRPGVGVVLLPYLDSSTALPRDQTFDIELRGEHGVILAQARAEDSTVHEFVGGTKIKTFIELPHPPELDLAGVEVWVRTCPPSVDLP